MVIVGGKFRDGFFLKYGGDEVLIGDAEGDELLVGGEVDLILDGTVGALEEGIEGCVGGGSDVAVAKLGEGVV